MEWFSDLTNWANENEGFLQALAMVGGIGALLLSGSETRNRPRWVVPGAIKEGLRWT